MNDRPILFSAPMIRAILEGRKTQTRRVLKPQPDPEFIMAEITPETLQVKPAFLFGTPTHNALRRLHKPGDRLWTRETLRFDWKSNNWQYDADKTDCVDVVGTELETPTPTRWPLGVCPSIHQPRHLSRITLLVEAVKVERLQDISPDDARAEGCCWDERDECLPDIREVHAFRGLWESINGADSWTANPWVAAYTFKRIFQNIDTIEAKP